MTWKMTLAIAVACGLAVVTLFGAIEANHVWGLGLLTLGAYFLLRRYQEDLWKSTSIVLCVVFMWGFAYNVMGSELLAQGKKGFESVVSGVFSNLINR